jgi:hypothetical protein
MTGWASLAFRTVLAIVSVILSFDLSDGIWLHALYHP